MAKDCATIISQPGGSVPHKCILLTDFDVDLTAVINSASVFLVWPELH